MQQMETHKNCFCDSTKLVLGKLKQLSMSGNKNSDYELGQIMAYYDVLDIIKDQAVLFGVSLKDLGIEGINLEQYLVTNSNESND